MALFRAVENAEPARTRLFSDPYAAGFLSGGLPIAARAARVPGARALVRRLIDRRASGPRVSAVVRTRLIDDAMERALADGARQVVLLGAGYDSRPYRIAGAQRARTFEVDHPSTQSEKRKRLARMRPIAPEVVWVSVDFLREAFGDALLGSGFDPREKAFIVWEGVSNYLTAHAVDATLRWVAANAAQGSALAFTYVHAGLLDGSARFPGAEPWMEAVERAGEPFTFGLDPSALPAYLAERGMLLVSDVSTAEALAQSPAARRETPPPAFYRVALAEVRATSSPS
jgi:methyltransferase (TIGR00027 family)